LKDFRNRRVAVLKWADKIHHGGEEEASSTSKMCLDLCGQSRRNWNVFVSVLLHMIVPSRFSGNR